MCCLTPPPLGSGTPLGEDVGARDPTNTFSLFCLFPQGRGKLGQRRFWCALRLDLKTPLHPHTCPTSLQTHSWWLSGPLYSSLWCGLHSHPPPPRGQTHLRGQGPTGQGTTLPTELQGLLTLRDEAVLSSSDPQHCPALRFTCPPGAQRGLCRVQTHQLLDGASAHTSHSLVKMSEE